MNDAPRPLSWWARHWPLPPKGGRALHLSALRRWIHKGRKGRKLRAHKVDGEWCLRWSDVISFLSPQDASTATQG